MSFEAVNSVEITHHYIKDGVDKYDNLNLDELSFKRQLQYKKRLLHYVEAFLVC